ncbi:MAG: NAD(P)H-hydrate dehydratase [Bacteroidota bacterium]|nr:NAD(P)H-hydrate dehydratase [Bacteroidota bacterium]
MKILTAEQIRNADAYTIEHEPISSVDLMERAARCCAKWIRENLSSFCTIKIFTGPGNNGGDGLAVARKLCEEGLDVYVFMLAPSDKLSPDSLVNYKRLTDSYSAVGVSEIESNRLPEISKNDLIIDALFGSGLSRPLSGLAATVVNHINQSGATVLSIDIPSGLFSEANTPDRIGLIICADYTLTFQMPKLSFLFAENEAYTGQWTTLDIGLLAEGINGQSSPYFVVEKKDIAMILHRRRKFSHKGTFGHALLMAGSYGKIGAEILSAKACLRTGVGLLTTHVVSKGYAIMQTAVPEAMVSIDPNANIILVLPDNNKYSAIGIGPGIGTDPETGKVLHALLQQSKVPLVLDADALNLLACQRGWMDNLPPYSILTPHPGEFDRLAGKSVNGYERHLRQIEFAKKYQVIVVLKGAYTSIVTPDGLCWFNSSGNPGMATAGSGDVLTGIILSLLAQGYLPVQAALIGVYLHGLAGDLAANQYGEEALIASDIINHLGEAFKAVRLKA